MKHTADLARPPIRSGKGSIPDGALNGHGELAVILATAAARCGLYCKQ